MPVVGLPRLSTGGYPVIRIVIEVPDQHKKLAQALKDAADRVTALGKRGGDGKAVDYAEVEREVAAAAAEVERAAHHDLLAGLDVDAKRVVIGGDVYTRVQRCKGAYHTMAGSIPRAAVAVPAQWRAQRQGGGRD